MLCLSSFFSGSEVAFFSLKHSDLDKLKLSHPFISHRINSILKNPSRLLISILISNTLVNITLAILAAMLTLSLIEKYHYSKAVFLLVEIVTVTLFLLVFGEVTPKITARRFAVGFALFATLPMSILIFILLPVTKIFEWVSKNVQSLFKYDKRKSAIGMGEIKYLTEIVESQSHVDSTTRSLFQNISELNYLTVKDILTPRISIEGYDIASNTNNLLSIIRNRKINFIPVFENNMDNIIGVLNLKDILKGYFLKNLSKEFIRSSLVKASNVPETKPLLDILKEFQLTRTQIAIVIDEHGGTAGIISFSDILNYLAGYNSLTDYNLGIRQIDKNTFLCDSSIIIKEVEKKMNVELIIEDANIMTIGGFVIHLFGHMPTVGEEIKYKNLLIKIIEVKGNRLKLIKIFQGAK